MAEDKIPPGEDLTGSGSQPDLNGLAAYGASQASPAGPERVRSLADRRRRRRFGGLALATAAAVAVAGGVAVQSTLGADSGPEVAAPPPATATPQPAPTPKASPGPTDADTASASPTPSASSPRAPKSTGPVSARNLLAPEDVPRVGRASVVVAGDGSEDSLGKSSVCIPDSPDVKATEVVSRNFGYSNPAARGNIKPTFYTQALQFRDEADAKRAYKTYKRWRDTCESVLYDRGYEPLEMEVRPEEYKVETGGQEVGTFLEWTYLAPDDTTGKFFFESIGLTRVDDRLMVTVMVVYAEDLARAYDPKGDVAAGEPPHEQFALITTAAQRLQR
jgi:hypothetical protein